MKTLKKKNGYVIVCGVVLGYLANKINKCGFGEKQCGRGKKRKVYDPARIRTWNPLIRSQMPYPLGHRATCLVGAVYCVVVGTPLPM